MMQNKWYLKTVQIYNVDQEFVLQIDADSPENDMISICNLG